MAEETDELERIYVIPIKQKITDVSRNKKSSAAMKLIKRFISRHMKTSMDKVWIDMNVNQAIWTNGIQNPPRSIKVRAVKFEEDDLVEVTLPED